MFADSRDALIAPYLFTAMAAARTALGDDIGVTPDHPIRFEILDDPAKLALVSPLTLDNVYTTGTVGTFGAAAAVAVVALLGFVFSGNEYDRAISDAKSASAQERNKKIDAAKKLINQQKEAKDRSWYLGELYRAVGESSAVGHYASAARAGATPTVSTTRSTASAWASSAS